MMTVLGKCLVWFGEAKNIERLLCCRWLMTGADPNLQVVRESRHYLDAFFVVCERLMRSSARRVGSIVELQHG